MKKIISVLLVLCMALACVLSFTPAVCAADGPAFSVTGATNADIGDTITLTLTADKGGFTGAEIQLDYDKTCLKLLDVNLELSATGKDVYGTADKMAQAPYAMLFSKASGTVADGTVLGDFTFEIVDAGKEDLTVAVGFTVGMPVVGGGTRLGQVVNGGTDLSASTSFTACTIKISGAVPGYNPASMVSDPENMWYGYVDEYSDYEFGYDGADDIIEMVFPADSEKLPQIDYAYGFDYAERVVFPATVGSIIDNLLVPGDGFECKYASDFYIFNANMVIGSKALGYITQTWKEGSGRTAKDVTEVLPATDNSHEKATLDEIFIHGWTGSTAETYAIENGFTFVPLEEYKTIGAQNGTNAIRFISRMKYADNYAAAKVVISATGTDDAGSAINKNAIEVPVSCVYKTIKGSTGGTAFVAKSCPEGYYLSAVSIKNLPTFTGSGKIVFSVKTYVKLSEDGEFVELDSQELTYDKNGYSGN